MQEISKFTLDEHEGDYECWPQKTSLFKNDVDTGIKIPGYIIEAQYELAEGYLLITSWNCPFEEANEFIWLNRSYKIIAHRRLGRWYGSYLLENHQPTGPTSLRLCYFDDLEFSLQLRKFGFLRRITLRRRKN